MDKSPIKFTLRQVEIIFKAEFHPPFLEVALAQDQANLLKNLCENFDIRFRDFIFNNQSISSGLIRFRKFFLPNEYFEAVIGVDEFQTTYFNPASAQKVWEPSIRVLSALSEIGDLTLKSQILTLNLHCTPEDNNYINYLNNINTINIDSDKFISKGAILLLKTPWESEMRIILDKSIAFTDSLFLLIQIYLNDSPDCQNIFSQIIPYFKNDIQPLLNMELIYKE